MTKDKIVGCLMGGAIGDCLGANTEFKFLSEIKELYGEKGLTDFIGKDGKGYITDDTQMTLFTIEAILNYEKDLNTDKSLIYEFMKSYKNWHYTQYNKYNSSFDVSSFNSELLGNVDMYRWRAPGNTCLTSIKQMDLSNKEYRAINDSKGCGAIMRTAPIGLYYNNDLQLVIKYTIENALLTHQHILSTLSCLYYNQLITKFAVGHFIFDNYKKDLANNIHLTMLSKYIEEKFTTALLKYNYSIESIKDNIDIIRNLWEEVIILFMSTENPSVDDIKQIGQGWVAEETLMIALYCVIQAKSFEECIILAANHDGDTDSTAALAGHLYGLINPNEVMNSKFFSRVNEKDLILDYSNKLFNVIVNKNGL